MSLSAYSKREKIILLLFILGLLAIWLAPYIYGYVNTPANMYFTGLIGQNGHDQAFYLAWGPRQAELGHLLFEDKFNGYTERRLVFNPLWLLAGFMSAITGLSTISMFHIERVVSSLFLLFVVYHIVSQFLTKDIWRLLALGFVFLGSGFGYFTLPLDGPMVESTPDLWVIEANIFLITLWEYVLPMGTAVFLLSIWWGYLAMFKNPRWTIRAGLMALLLSSLYPYAIVSVYFILGVAAMYLLMKKVKFWSLAKTYGIIVLISAPVVLYNFWIVMTDPKLTVGQALYSSPNLWQYVIGYGVVAIFAIPGLYLAYRKAAPAWNFLIIWIVVTFAQIYIPLELIAFQMQLILGIQIPLAILASLSLLKIVDWASHKFDLSRTTINFAAGIAAIVLLSTSTITNVYHYKNVFAKLDKGAISDYLHLDTMEGMKWLEENTDDEEQVIASTPISPYIPVFAHNRMYCSDYNAPTADFPVKQAKINWLFSNSTIKNDIEIIEFLSEEKIDYIFYDRILYEMGGEMIRNQIDQLEQSVLVFENPQVSIFKIN